MIKNQISPKQNMGNISQIIANIYRDPYLTHKGSTLHAKPWIEELQKLNSSDLNKGNAL